MDWREFVGKIRADPSVSRDREPIGFVSGNARFTCEVGGGAEIRPVSVERSEAYGVHVAKRSWNTEDWLEIDSFASCRIGFYT